MIQRRVVVPVDAERLWQALTDPDEAGRWLGGELDWTVEEGEPLRFAPRPGGAGGAGGGGEGGAVREGRVDAVIPGRYLRFRWWPQGSEPDDGSEVSYVLEPAPESDPDAATVLTVEEVPVGAGAFACASSAGWSPIDQLHFEMWAIAPAGCRIAV